MAKSKTRFTGKVIAQSALTAGGIISSILIGFGTIDLFRSKGVDPVNMIIVGLLVLSLTFVLSRK